jgi:hypothetical protein
VFPDHLLDLAEWDDLTVVERVADHRGRADLALGALVDLDSLL